MIGNCDCWANALCSVEEIVSAACDGCVQSIENICQIYSNIMMDNYFDIDDDHTTDNEIGNNIEIGTKFTVGVTLLLLNRGLIL